MLYRLTIYPALEAGNVQTEFLFETAKEMVAAKDTAADLLLFIQDQMTGIMESYSNMFLMEEFACGEWQEWEQYEDGA